MNAKRILAAVLAVALLTELTACSLFSKTEKTTQTPSEQAVSVSETQPQTTLSDLVETLAPETTAAPAAQSAEGNPVPQQRVGNGLNPLTGLPGYDADYYAGKKLVGVVVENHPGARPQWGMSTPDVVFEYEVEGGISRMLWLYANPDEMPAMVGPVRSMRHDIVELARGYDLVFVHCGGSYIARDKMASYNGALTDFDEQRSASCFFRNTTRDTAIEHRLVLRGDSFRTAYANLGSETVTDAAHQNILKFADVNTPFRPTEANCGSVHFEYSGYYTYTFNFNAATGLYEANINGSPRVDDQNIQCAYKNLVLLYVDMVDMGTEKGHQDLLLEKGGRGIYATNGGYMSVTWQKGTDTDMLRLYDANGAELTLNAGNSYIGLVRSTQSAKTVIG